MRLLRAPVFSSEDLARIHDAVGIEDLSNLAHQADFQRVFIAAEILALELSNAVFGTDAAAITRYFVQHLRRQSLSVKLEKIARRARRAREIVVKIAIAEMTEHDQPHARVMPVDALSRRGKKRGNGSNRQRDIMLHMRTIGTLGFRDFLAKPPHAVHLCN